MNKVIFLKVYLTDGNMLDTNFTVTYSKEDELINRLIIEAANILYKRGILTTSITDIQYDYVCKV